MHRDARRGFTLAEMLVVVAVMAAVAAVAVSRLGGIARAAKAAAAESDLKTLATAFTDGETGYMRDMRGIPGFSPAQMRVANLLVSTNVYGSTGADGLSAGFRVDDGTARAGCAAADVFTTWNAESERGWHGPYVRSATGAFPGKAEVRFPGDASFGARGFYPELGGLRLPADIVNGLDGCSAYGFPGEPAVIDPWGNPYVLQIPPPQAFGDAAGVVTNVPDEVRFRYARIVSAGPDGTLETPCFAPNRTNQWATLWGDRQQRLCRQAGLIDGDRSARGDDLVLFLVRNDIDEGDWR